MSANKSIWRAAVDVKQYKKLLSDIECDVLVIGGGIVGILTAYYLSRQGVDVVVVDASSVCSGQTLNTTAKITSQHGACYQKIAKNFSLDTALLFANANEKAIDDFDKLIFDKQINCDFVRLPSYLYTTKSVETLEREFAFTQKSNINAVLTTRTELPFDVKLALCYHNQAQLHPLKFLYALTNYISIFENTKVDRVEDNIAYCESAKIKAKKIVFATHYPIVNFPGLYFARMHQSRSYVLALKNAMRLKSMYYGIDKGALSFRGYNDLLIMSGGSHRTGENACSPYDQLSAKAKQIFPDGEICYHFSAQDCMTPDNMPYAGVYAKSKPNWYVLTGFSKWGMTNSMMSAELVSDLILNKNNPLRKILSPRRFNLSTVKPVLNETLHAVKGLSKTAFRIPVYSVADIPYGGAKVVNFGGKRCGVYKSEEGELFAVSARCPHLGCALSWNSTEKTWDCPCHGSRFTYRGELIDCPSQTSLKRYK